MRLSKDSDESEHSEKVMSLAENVENSENNEISEIIKKEIINELRFICVIDDNKKLNPPLFLLQKSTQFTQGKYLNEHTPL